MIEHLAGWGKSFDVSLTKEIVLQTERLFPYFIQDGQSEILLFLALLEVLDPRVFCSYLAHLSIF